VMFGPTSAIFLVSLAIIPINSKSLLVVAGIFPFQLSALFAASQKTKPENQ
jgi:hypothetical protein